MNFLFAHYPRHPDFGFRIFKRPIFWLVLFVILVGISILFAGYKGVAVYRFIKLIEFIFLFFYTADILKRVSFLKIALAFSLSGIFQGILAIGQFAFQKSLGFYLLGEPHLVAGRQEVAEFVAFGARFMRAYGTFSSPNVLAAFLGISFLFLLTWFFWKKGPVRKQLFFTWTGTVIIGIGLILTFSRAVIFAFLLVVIFYIFAILFSRQFGHLKKKMFFALAPMFSAAFLFTLIFWPEVYSRVLTAFARGDLAIRERLFFNNLSLQVISQNFFGVGAGNYTLYLRDVFSGLHDRLYQPVHNIFLLLAAESGVLALIVFILFITVMFGYFLKKYSAQKDILGLFYISATVFIITGGLFDHFYLTIQQGGLMFWILLGAGYSYIRK
ncbi:MAG: O-antigen ligase family protein [Candidatus Spechtbacterales bacterium]